MKMMPKKKEHFKINDDGTEGVAQTQEGEEGEEFSDSSDHENHEENSQKVIINYSYSQKMFYLENV